MVEHQEKDNLEMVNLAPGLLGSLDTNQKIQGSLPLFAVEGTACPSSPCNPCLSPAQHNYMFYFVHQVKIELSYQWLPSCSFTPSKFPYSTSGGLGWAGETNNLDFRNVDTLELGPMLQILLAGSKENY